MDELTNTPCTYTVTLSDDNTITMTGTASLLNDGLRTTLNELYPSWVVCQYEYIHPYWMCIDTGRVYNRHIH